MNKIEQTKGIGLESLFETHETYNQFLSIIGSPHFDALRLLFSSLMILACTDVGVATLDASKNIFVVDLPAILPGFRIHADAFCRGIAEEEGPLAPAVEDLYRSTLACLLESSIWPLFWKDLTMVEFDAIQTASIHYAARKNVRPTFGSLLMVTAIPLPEHPVDPILKFVVWLSRHRCQPPEWYTEEWGRPIIFAQA